MHDEPKRAHLEQELHDENHREDLGGTRNPKSAHHWVPHQPMQNMQAGVLIWGFRGVYTSQMRDASGHTWSNVTGAQWPGCAKKLFCRTKSIRSRLIWVRLPASGGGEAQIMQAVLIRIAQSCKNDPRY